MAFLCVFEVLGCLGHVLVIPLTCNYRMSNLPDLLWLLCPRCKFSDEMLVSPSYHLLKLLELNILENGSCNK